MLEINFVWTSTGSSGGLTPVNLQAGCEQSVLYCEASTLASTQSFSFQTAPTSSGPWFTEASTSVGGGASATAQAAIRLTGTYIWMRPFINSASTGNYTLRLIANGAI